ncbi:MAG: hypothetical protein OEZ59_06140 [Deltaproteobacteria bacterium]|nr:hypothetical protein [Deltaproteobacteria bacterium]
MKNLFSAVTALVLLGAVSGPAHADLIVERRQDQFGKDFGYFVYPIATEIPGLGQAAGLGATVLNMFGTDADFTGFNLKGDLDVHGYALLDVHLLKELVVVDGGDYGFHVMPMVFQRGMDSDPDNYILPEVEGKYQTGQITLTLKQRLFEAYWRILKGKARVLSIMDSDLNQFENVDKGWADAKYTTVGGILDNTDDRLDPRKGVRLEYARKMPEIRDPWQSEYAVKDLNVSAYIPFGKMSTLSFNFFRSDAEITRQASTNYAELEAALGMPCEALPPAEQPGCLATEAEFINQRIAENRYGTATSLGGTQRLRSYPGGRFLAGHTLFYGVEYRWNLNDEHTPFDIWLARGIRTGFQLSVFTERGTVNDNTGKLWENMRTSSGVGFRMRLSGVIIRLDIARGDEGQATVFFINYPWGMFSVDNPG